MYTLFSFLLGGFVILFLLELEDNFVILLMFYISQMGSVFSTSVWFPQAEPTTVVEKHGRAPHKEKQLREKLN